MVIIAFFKSQIGQSALSGAAVKPDKKYSWNQQGTITHCISIFVMITLKILLKLAGWFSDPSVHRNIHQFPVHIWLHQF